MTTDHRSAFARYLRTGDSTELRAMGVSPGSAGGYMAPQEFRNELTETLKSYGKVFADFDRFETTNGRTMFAPVASFSGAGVLVSENPVSAIGATDRTYAQVSLGAYTVASGVHQVSIQVEQDSAFPMETIISAFAGEMIGRALAAYSATGTGSGQPTGVYTATASTALSLAAAQAVEVNGAASTELTSGALSPGSLLKMVQALDPAYADDAKWYMNTASYAALCEVTDTTGQPLIRPNGPRVLHGFPIVLANELSSLTASTVSGPILANLKRAFYWRDAGIEVLRLAEKYADYGAAGYVGYWRGDFQPRDVRAIVAVKAAAS